MDSVVEAGEARQENSEHKLLPPPGHYSWKRPKSLIDTDLDSDHDPKEKQSRSFWDNRNIFNVS